MQVIPPRVLLVDDDRAFAEMCRAAMEVDGFDVQIASNAKESLTFTALSLPDLVLLDVHLPDIDGVTLLKMWRGDPRSESLKVIFVANADYTAFIARAFDLGALDFLQKQRLTPRALCLRAKIALASESPDARLGHPPGGEPPTN